MSHLPHRSDRDPDEIERETDVLGLSGLVGSRGGGGERRLDGDGDGFGVALGEVGEEEVVGVHPGGLRGWRERDWREESVWKEGGNERRVLSVEGEPAGTGTRS